MRKSKNEDKSVPVEAVTATTPEAYAANLENFAAVARATAKRHDWCSAWFDTLMRISPAFVTENDDNERGGRRIVVTVANVPGAGALAGMDMEVDLTDTGRAKYQAMVTAALLADATHIRNRVARLARDSNITIDEANEAIATLGDAEAFPRITTDNPGKYAYLPQIKFTTSDDSTANSVLGARLSTAFSAWLASGIKGLEGFENITIFEDDMRADVYNMSVKTEYGDMELIPRR